MRSYYIFLTLLFPFFAMAQNQQLDKLWKEVDQSMNNGQFKSLEPNVLKIKSLAQSQKDDANYIKALFYEAKIKIATMENTDDVNFVIETFAKEINGKSKIRDAVVQMYLAKLYFLYFQENEYKINSRTSLENASSEDIRFWDFNAFEKRIEELYQKAIQPKKELIQENLSNWAPLIDDNNSFEKGRDLTPTLYDVIVHEYISYLDHGFNFSISDENDKKANQYNQELAEFNIQKGEFNAFLYNQHEQLVRLESSITQEEFNKEINQLASIYEKDAWYSAVIYSAIVERLMHEDELKKGSYNKIFEIEQKLKKLYPNSDQTKYVLAQADKIRAKEFRINSEQYLLPNENIPVNIFHKNVDQLYVRVYKYKTSFYEKDAIHLESYHSSTLKNVEKYLKGLTPVDEYTIDIKSFDDYQTHSSVYKLNPLASGNYIVLISTDKLFDVNKKDETKFMLLSASNYMINSIQNKFYVLDRKSGKPIKNQEIEYVNLNNSSNQPNKIITDDLGRVKIDGYNQYHNLKVKVKGDDLIYNFYLYNSNNIKGDQAVNTAKILTDRAIYRPSQTIYYKSILYKTINKESEVIPNTPITIILNDVNGKEVAKTTGQTNEFGSFNGSFQIPASGLTGNFQIYVYSSDQSIRGNQWVRVEEYKRPKFEVKVDDQKGIYKIDDLIEVTGKAEAFSGASIDQAVVKYNITRQELFTYWPWYRSIPYGRSYKEVMAFGEIKTDAEGKFNFNFIAKPKEQRKDVDRLYNYTIEVSVTDINGETQSTTSNVKVGDKRLVLSFDLNERITIKDVESFNISIKNVNDVKQEGKGKVEVYRLKSPDRVLKSNSWETSYNYYTEKQFNQLFPTYSYASNDIPKNWELGEKIAEHSYDTSISSKVSFNNLKNLEEGYYVIKGFVMDGNDKVENEQIVFIANPKKPNKYTLITASTDKSSYKVGEEVKITFQSPIKDVFVFYSINENNQSIREGVLDLKHAKTVKFNVSKEHLGGTALSYFVVNNNDFKTDKVDVAVPMESKDLKITTSVIRDKLTPGSLEKWQIKITGDQKDKFSSEVLAAMYDASLDQFVKHSLNFNPNIYRTNYVSNYFSQMNTGINSTFSNSINSIWDNEIGGLYHAHGLNFKVFNFGFNRNYISYNRENVYHDAVLTAGVAMNKAEVYPEAKSLRQKDYAEAKKEDITLNEVSVVDEPKLDQVQARKVLNETAFFYPNLMTDKDGNVIIEFTAPESLTEWKFMTLAHTKDLKIGYLEQRVKTQKELMVVPNAPRFLREGDQVAISTKINNLSDKVLNGSAKLMLFDPFTNEPIDSKFKLNQPTQNFNVAKGNSDQVTWILDVPKNIQAVVYRVVAVAGDFSDGEESALPILTNRMLVTETMPIYIKENQNKTFNFKNLEQNKSETLDHFKLTFEMTVNPIWNAIFALPYLREYPYECAEQVFSRLYGNMVSEKIINSNPKIKAVFDQWNAKGDLKSKLQVNEELKNIILEETPWVRSAENEETQMKQIATLFQMNQMQNEMKSAFEKLSAKQQANGAFAWFEGGNPNEYITTHIVAGFGNLKKMNVNFNSMGIQPINLVGNAIQYMDQENLKRYNEFKKDLKSFKNIIYSDGIHYLYARSFFLDQFPMDKNLEEMKNVMLKNLNEKKLDLSLQQKAIAALVLKRFGMESAAKQVLISTRETAVLSDEMGMYWKNNQPGWFWYNAPVETQAMLIEAYDEVLNDVKSVEEMKVWLIKNKQTNQWNSTKATTKAVYALMNTGKSWIDAEKGINVKIGNENFDIEKNSQAGSGYVKTIWNSDEIKPELGKVEVSKTSPGVAYGAMYWQYFEDLDQIKSAETGIKFNKKLYVKSNSANGPVLREITSQTPIKIGDVVTVRLEISIDRNMEFVHIKDMRASGFEPVNVLSGYKWKGEFGYYESTRDASTNFFADFMRKGTYVFEYDLKANNAGNFSNGITSMQNMYAPELSAQSEGIRVEIKN
ncbi:alpha-2-macroglobulin family protein [Faecalibacter bovis]|uniref:Alpha-2-macroglobulin domain-containing protein n=1 Tax=Faecalibacter bovis TaxID=2898187 RepID=A0ABX7XBC2_9FLAO|nr:alpha-2-macroglobulin family protein [Faecalibacter bovis]QTV05208.1 hypothetical protein J9309_10525 [Faecalibacter bovis]